ncbi:hypothetical protein Cgig2_023422 [Carnegiea gigantea]|uniref:Uncharacterized protein n=1 Tax=Carnegiea gigantea TaxID=171969 RepID=A0A9Q1K4J7_9CARY|nr:hypothetical protein Cgig2_023422 [Carnegiea gigantea]
MVVMIYKARASWASHLGLKPRKGQESASFKNGLRLNHFKAQQGGLQALTVVTSIACDPNVWNAVMQNPALVEFLQSEKKGAEFEAHESAESSIGLDNNGKPDSLIGIFEDVKRSVLDMVSSLTNFIQSLFAEPNGGKKSESADGTAKNLIAGGTFMALALVVIMVVVMKRG